MCVIIIKKQGMELPSRRMLKAAYDANPDGCGFATSSGEYWRGLQFNDFYRELTERAKVEDNVVMHFRWATHGSVKETNCHPFQGEFNGEPIWFAHNGVLPIPSKNDMTDSEICFRERLLPYLNKRGAMDKQTKAYISRQAQSSRFAMLTREGITLFGSWSDYQGYLCSNLHFVWRLTYSESYGYKRPLYFGVGKAI